MRIYIKTNEKKFTIPIIMPVFLIKVFIKIGRRYIYKYVNDEEALKYINSLDFNKLCDAFDVLKEYKRLEIINVKSSDGAQIRIII